MNLISVVEIDPMAPRATTPVLVGKCAVNRKPMPGTPHTLYQICYGGAIVRTQLSYPSQGDCDAAVTAARARLQAASKKAEKPRAARFNGAIKRARKAA